MRITKSKAAFVWCLAVLDGAAIVESSLFKFCCCLLWTRGHLQFWSDRPTVTAGSPTGNSGRTATTHICPSGTHPDSPRGASSWKSSMEVQGMPPSSPRGAPFSKSSLGVSQKDLIVPPWMIISVSV